MRGGTASSIAAGCCLLLYTTTGNIITEYFALELRPEMATLDSELRGEIATLGSELRGEMGRMRTDFRTLFLGLVGPQISRSAVSGGPKSPS